MWTRLSISGASSTGEQKPNARPEKETRPRAPSEAPGPSEWNTASTELSDFDWRLALREAPIEHGLYHASTENRKWRSQGCCSLVAAWPVLRFGARVDGFDVEVCA
jgi:hypothetical protein